MFLAPTKPLVAQQLAACRARLDVPSADIVELSASGQGQAGERRKAQWATARMFFCTPQILENDIKKGICSEEQVGIAYWATSRAACRPAADCELGCHLSFQGRPHVRTD